MKSAIFPNRPNATARLTRNERTLAAAQSSSVNLLNWDTASAIDMTTLNASIVSQGKTPGTFLQSNAFVGSVSGKWGPWQVFPDSNSNGSAVRMACPVVSGVGTDITGASYKLDGAVAYITVTLADVPTPSVPVVDKTAIPGTGNITSIAIEATGTAAIPPVVINNMTPASVMSQFSTLFGDWFVANVHKFDALFHTAILNVLVDQKKDGNMQWVKPQFLSYATITNSANVGLFGALCKITKGPYGALAQQLPPGLLYNMPDGCNSVFAISGEKFAEKFLLQGAIHCVPGAKESDFEFVADGLGVRNINPLNWVPIDFGGTVVTPVVPVGGLTVKVSEDQIQLDFSGVTWDHQLVLGIMGNDVFTLDFTQLVYLALKFDSKGNPVFVTSNNPVGAPSTSREVPTLVNPKVTCVPDKTAVTAQRAVSIISMALAALGGVGGIFKVCRWIGTAWSAPSDLAPAVVAILNEGESVVQILADVESLGPAAAKAEVAASNAEALAVAGGSALSTSAKAATYFTRFAMAGGLVGLAGVGLNYWAKCQMGKDNDILPDTVPSMNGFIDNVLGTAHWPALSTWELQEAQLAESLLLYGKLST